jgi:ABC-type branched-subunit amino acid transport system permease subunit
MQRFLARARVGVWFPWVALVGGVAVTGVEGNLLLIGTLTTAAIMALWGVSFNFIWGFAGQFSMAQIGLGGLSAYVTALLVTKAAWSFWPACGIGIGAAVLASAVLGLASLRLAGFQFAIMTLAFVLLMISVTQDSAFAGRDTGIVAPFHFGSVNLGVLRWNLDSQTGGFLGLVTVSLVAVLVLTSCILRTRTGRALVALREDEILGQSVGIRASTYRLIAFAISAVIAGAAGELYAGYLRYLTPDFFGFDTLITLIVIVVLGGRGYSFGPVVGAAIYYGLVQYLNLSPGVFGVVLICMVLLAPDGILGLLDARRSRARFAILRGLRRGHSPLPTASK